MKDKEYSQTTKAWFKTPWTAGQVFQKFVDKLEPFP
jgi:hypothetical protein